MKKLLRSLALILIGFANGQTTLFEDSFDTYEDFIISGIGNWTLVDGDLRPTYGFTGVTFTNSGIAKSYQVFNSTATTPTLTTSSTSDWSARTGDKNLVCFAAVPNATVTANNDWLISPQITLGASGNTLSFWAKSCSSTYGLEKFRVGISTTDTATSSFTIISDDPITTLNDVTYVEYTYNLDTYAGQPIYISINCVSDDQFGFAIDDFKVTANVLHTDSFFKNNLSVSPNPAKDLITISNSSNVVIDSAVITDINGRIVKTSASSQINISDLNSGVYFLKVTTDQGVGTTKVIKN